MKILRMMILALVVVVGVGMAMSANATVMLRLDNPNDAFPALIIPDGDPLDANPLANTVTYVGAVSPVDPTPTWYLNVTTGLAQQGSNSAFMDLNSVDSSNARGQLQICLTATNLLVDSPYFDVISSIGGTLALNAGQPVGGSLNMAKYYDVNNTPFAGDFIHNLYFDGSGAFSGSVSSTVAGTSNPFSLTDCITITHNGAATTSFDAANNVNPVPEPGTLMLLGSGLLGIAGYSRIKFGKKKKA